MTTILRNRQRARRTVAQKLRIVLVPAESYRLTQVRKMAFEKGFWRAFLDFFVLFSGISTASNLSRTRPAPVRRRGMFLFRKKQ